MANYVSPEGWVVLKVTFEGDTHSTYKIFCSWRSGDCWRLSSGSQTLCDIRVTDGDLIWPQQSGTVYRLARAGQGGMTAYTAMILDRMINGAKSNGGSVDEIDPFELLKDLHH